MLDFLKKIFTPAASPDFAEMLSGGKGVIVDVRSRGEYQTGCIAGSLNIPVNELEKNLSKLKDKQAPIICCCASGMRSGQARTILIKNGYTNVYNGGGWRQLMTRIS